MLKTPLWITNFKNYKQATGANALKLAKIHESVAHKTGKNIAIAVSPLDLQMVSQAVSIPVFAQHVDPVEYGSCTGSIVPGFVSAIGARGSLLNHSEKRVEPETRQKTIEALKSAGLIQVLCAENPKEVAEFRALKPDSIAFEPPELIGSSDASVSSAKPDSIRASVQNAPDIDILVGAGISTTKDVEIALQLGAKGFLVASAITKSPDPEKALEAFVSVW